MLLFFIRKQLKTQQNKVLFSSAGRRSVSSSGISGNKNIFSLYHTKQSVCRMLQWRRGSQEMCFTTWSLVLGYPTGSVTIFGFSGSPGIPSGEIRGCDIITVQGDGDVQADKNKTCWGNSHCFTTLSLTDPTAVHSQIYWFWTHVHVSDQLSSCSQRQVHHQQSSRLSTVILTPWGQKAPTVSRYPSTCLRAGGRAGGGGGEGRLLAEKRGWGGASWASHCWCTKWKTAPTGSERFRRLCVSPCPAERRLPSSHLGLSETSRSGRGPFCVMYRWYWRFLFCFISNYVTYKLKTIIYKTSSRGEVWTQLQRVCRDGAQT